MIRKSHWLLAALMPLAIASVGAQQTQSNSPPQSSSSGQTTSAPPPNFPQQPVNYPASAPNAAQSPDPQQPPAYPPPPSGHTAAPTYRQPPTAQPAADYSLPPPSYQPAPNYPFSQGHAADQVAPYHVHRDTRHGHDHVYPDRGSVVREVPRGALVVNYAGLSYRFFDGTWLEPRGPAFMVVSPPIGLVVQTLPPFATAISSGADSYLYADDVYYRPRPDIGGYEVVNDPALGTAGSAAPAAVPSASPPGSTASPALLAPVAPPAAIVPAVAPAPAQPVLASAPPPPTAAVPLNASAASTTPSMTAAASSSFQPPRATRVIAYPRNGQTAEQQARDQYECYRFAVAQAGFDPLHANGGIAVPQAPEPQADFERAQAACFEGRGYTIR